MATLIEMRGKGHISKETRRRLNKFVEDKTRAASTRLKKWLGLKCGRPRDFTQREVWAIGADLKEKNPKKFSYGNVARKLDPKGYDEDPHLAKERMRQGILAVQREKAQPRGKSD
jgi:hypothetical protein